MECGIYWFTGTRELQSVLLSPVLEKGLTKAQGLMGGTPPPKPPSPPLSKTLL